MRILSGLWTACFVLAAVLLVVAPDAARFGFAALALTFAAIGLSMAADLGGAAVATSRWVGEGARTPKALASPKVARIWGAVCFVLGLVVAAQALFDEGF